MDEVKVIYWILERMILIKSLLGRIQREMQIILVSSRWLVVRPRWHFIGFDKLYDYKSLN